MSDLPTAAALRQETYEAKLAESRIKYILDLVEHSAGQGSDCVDVAPHTHPRVARLVNERLRSLGYRVTYLPSGVVEMCWAQSEAPAKASVFPKASVLRDRVQRLEHYLSRVSRIAQNMAERGKSSLMVLPPESDLIDSALWLLRRSGYRVTVEERAFRLGRKNSYLKVDWGAGLQTETGRQGMSANKHATDLEDLSGAELDAIARTIFGLERAAFESDTHLRRRCYESIGAWAGLYE